MGQSKTVIIIAGPTAVGKTALAIWLAQHFNTQIISADSRQCYTELNIGVAKPTSEELAAVPHHFISSHVIHQKVDAAIFEQYALNAADNIFKNSNIAIMVGGTGMYIRAFCEGLDVIPETTETVQNDVRNSYAIHGLDWLQQAVATEDPTYFETGETQNPQRLMRALEVKRSTGQSIRFFQNRKPVGRPFNIIKTGLELPRPELNERIHQRIDIMMKEGLLDEVTSLLPFRHLNALQTVGYSEIFKYIDGDCTLETAVDQLKTNTRQYAKRQMTWFKRDAGFTWFHPGSPASVKTYLEEKLSS